MESNSNKVSDAIAEGKRHTGMCLNRISVMEKYLRDMRNTCEEQKRNFEVMQSVADDDQLKHSWTFEKLQVTNEQLGAFEELSHTLTAREQLIRDEMNEVCVKLKKGFYDTWGSRRDDFGIKRLGKIDKRPFLETCMQKFPPDEARLKACELRSFWQDKLTDPEWYPFHVVEDDNGIKQKVVNENDELLVHLKNTWGEQTYFAVVTAFKELNEHNPHYNPSGDYTVPELWNFRHNRKASAKEVISYIFKQIKSRKREKAPVDYTKKTKKTRTDIAQKVKMNEILRTSIVPEAAEKMYVGGTSGLGGVDSENEEAGKEELVVDNVEQSESEEEDVEQFESQQEEKEDEDVVDEVEKKDTEPWKLVEAVEGGPQEVELLRGFLSHVAYHIWNGKDRGLLRAKKSYESMIDSWLPDLSKKPKVAELVENLGVFGLKNLMHKRVDIVTVSAFVERWHPETNSFHFPWGEVTMTLHDIGYLSGLPIVGKLPFEKLSTGVLQEKFAGLLGCSKDVIAKKYWKSGCLKYTFIKEKMKNGQGSPEKVAKIYLMWLLSATLFADKSKFGLLGDLLPFVDKLKEVDSYNWAAAALVNLYRQLGVASRNDCVQISGCLTFLQGWIWTYFPCFRPENENKNWNSDKPWVLRWDPKCFHPNLKLLKECREKLDCLTVDQVDWTPFHSNPAQQHPASTFHGVLQFRQIKEPYMPDRVMRQFGYVQTIPVEPYQPLREVRSKPNQYIAEYNFSPDAFKLLRMHCVRFEGASRDTTGGEVAEDYLEWFVPRTHSYVLPPCKLEAPKDDGLKEQLEKVFDLVKGVRDANVDKDQALDVIDRIYDAKARFANEKDSGAAEKSVGKSIRKRKRREDDNDREIDRD